MASARTEENVSGTLQTINKETKISIGLMISLLFISVGAYGLIVTTESKLKERDAHLEARVLVNEVAVRDLRLTLRDFRVDVRDLTSATNEAALQSTELRGSIDVLNERLEKLK
ncbi:MAG: hypothetical protein LC667_02210 [Thioalkalivibrio sp.]|nr:hypothetical protein [Thioalkalivibrio sp.]